MAVSALSAAKTLCQLRDWSISNMALQKILYLAHMVRLGESDGTPLVSDAFEAWDYGPVVPDLYRRAKPFGSGPVRNVFHWIASVDPSTPDFIALKEAAESTKNLTPGRLVSITHWPNGAWAKRYVAGARGIVIPNSDILEEYRDRARESRIA